MPYLISSDRVSTRALYSRDDYIAHSISWGKHRYVRREGTPGKYRYIYPEDLKTAGSRLVTGAKNLASRAVSVARKATTAVGSVTGHTQDRKVTQARAELREAQDKTARLRSNLLTYDERANRELGRYSESSRQSATYKNLQGHMQRVGKQNYDRYYKAVDRENAAAARLNAAMSEAYDAPLRKAIRVLKNIPFHISLEVQEAAKHARDEIFGTGYKDEIIKLRRKRDRYSFNPDLSEMYDQQYRDAITLYGKTFAGNMERILNTEFYESILRRG